MAITDLPSSEDFYSMGVEHIMIGYDGILDLYHPLLNYMEYDNSQKEDQEEFWDSARLKVLVLTGLIHEGFDFILKSKICEVNPLLLIKNDPKELKGNKKFSECFTHNSSDLPIIVNAFCPNPLNAKFIELFEAGRKRRNKIRHTFDKDLQAQAEKIIIETLEMFSLISNEKWTKIRLKYVESDEVLRLYSADVDFYRERLLTEFDVLTTILQPARFQKHYGAKKKQRYFLCFECNYPDYADERKTTFIETDSSGTCYSCCIICENKVLLKNEECMGEVGCKSKLIDSKAERCIACGQ